MEYKVKQGQTLQDVALQVYGTSQLVYKLAKENGLRVDDDITTGQILHYEEGAGDKIIATAIRDRALIIANR